MTSAPMRVRHLAASKFVMVLTPDLPSSNPVQKSITEQPKGLTTPRPVIKTRCRFSLWFSSIAGYFGPSSNYGPVYPFGRFSGKKHQQIVRLQNAFLIHLIKND